VVRNSGLGYSLLRCHFGFRLGTYSFILLIAFGRFDILLGHLIDLSVAKYLFWILWHVFVSYIVVDDGDNVLDVLNCWVFQLVIILARRFGIALSLDQLLNLLLENIVVLAFQKVEVESEVHLASGVWSALHNWLLDDLGLLDLIECWAVWHETLVRYFLSRSWCVL
jgi:hypothetical protein